MCDRYVSFLTAFAVKTEMVERYIALLMLAAARVGAATPEIAISPRQTDTLLY